MGDVTNEAAQIRRDRLQKWLDDRGLSKTDLANMLGVSKSYASLLFKPYRHFGEKAARSIEKKLLLPEGYLDMPDGKATAVSEWNDPRDLDDDVYALVPHITLEVQDGKVVDVKQELPFLALPASKLVRRGVRSRGKLRLVRAPDRSMEPGLSDGDQVLVDLGQSKPEDGAVYALRHGKRVIVRRVFMRADGSLRLHPDNPSFPDEDIQDGDDCEVIGRKVWRGG